MDLLEMSKDCLQMYFNGKPPANQFMGRAYLCKSQLYTPVSTDNLVSSYCDFLLILFVLFNCNE